MRPYRVVPRAFGSRSRRPLPFAAAVTLLAVVTFAGTLFVITPSQPRAAVFAYVKARTATQAFSGTTARPYGGATDRHFRNCDAARAAGRENIPSWDPSYREWMDGDGDGWACEPYGGRY